MSTAPRSPRMAAPPRSPKMPSPSRSPRMLTPPRSPGRRPPMPVMPPSTQSLTGMEKVVPPRRPSMPRSTGSSQSDMNKPLPPAPSVRRPSSSYSTDSGYTKIVESYDSDDEAAMQSAMPAVPQILPLHQPNAYRETISGLLNRRLHDPPSPRQTPSIPSLQQHSFAVSPPLSADEDRFTASFADLSLRSDSSHSHRVSPLSSPRSQEFKPASSPRSPKFQTIAYNTSTPPVSLSPRLPPLDAIDPNIVPRPLSVRPQSHLRSSSQLPAPRTPNSAPAAPLDSSQAHSHFSTSSDTSSSEYVIYTSIRDSLRAYIREKRRKKQLAKLDKQHRRILSTLSAKYPGASNSKSTYDLSNSHRRSHRKASWGSQRRASVQSLAQEVYGRVRRFSTGNTTTDHSSGKEGAQSQALAPRKRRGSKQRAVPTSPYQKWGAAIWEAPKRSERKRQKHGHRRGPSDPLHDVSRAFHSGQSGLVEAMGMESLDEKKKRKEKKRRLTAEEKRREALKRKIVLVGPAELTSGSQGLGRSGRGGERQEGSSKKDWI